MKPREEEGNAGTYAYDRALGRVVKVSDRIPGVAGKRRRAAPEPGPCGGGPCGGGACRA